MTRFLRLLATSVLAITVIALSGLLNPSFAGDVTIDHADHELQIRIDGTDFATYNYSSELPKPFFLPVKAADGTVLTRELNDDEDKDHPHHKGVWLSVDEVNDIKYWVERGPITTQNLEVAEKDGSAASFTVTNHWQKSESKEPVVTEKTLVTIFPNRLMTWDIRFIAEHGPVEFHDTKEGLLGFRMAASLKERNSGHVVSSDGTVGTRNCWGKPFPWIDYSGKIDDGTYGVTLMDHPDNFRKARYHVRDYGLFSISPFGEHAYSNGAQPRTAVILKPGEELRLRYAIYFHDGDAEHGGVAEAYDAFVGSTR